MAAATNHPSKNWMEVDETQLIGCPHCLGLSGSCHVCDGAGRVSFIVAQRVVVWAWATPGCGCRACKRDGMNPPARSVDWRAA